MANLLITGGFGFIGSHLCITLLESNHNIIVLDSYINSSKKVLRRLEKIFKNSNINLLERLITFEGDIRNFEIMNNVFLKAINIGNPIDGVIHLAGLKSVNDSFKYPLDYWSNNVNGTINLLKVMDTYNCRNIVFSSSATVYGDSQNIPLRENNEINPISTYGHTKAAIERILKDLNNKSSNKWRIAILRYFNPVGAHCSGLIGEAPCGVPNNIFPFLTQVGIGIRKELNIYGNDWPTYDGTGVRDYIHVMDLASGHISALNFLIQNDPQIITLNLGTGIGTSVLELIDTFQKVNDVKIPYKIREKRDGDIAVLIADNKLALSKLDWYPKNKLENMCRDGWLWQSKNPKGYY